MLKQRIITAVILSAVSLWAMLGWNDFFFSLFLLTLTTACAWEWGDLVAITPRELKIAYTVIVAVVAAVCMTLINAPVLSAMVLTGTTLWIAIACDLVARPVLAADTDSGGSEKTRWLLLIAASFLLLLCVCCIYWLRQTQGPAIVIYTIALVAAADTGAYFCGRKFGKRKLAVQISGGKTIEGAAGGLAAALLLAVIACGFLATEAVSAISILAMSVFAAMLSIAGDLFISRAKRTRDVKDSGTLLPGHGGVLDRFDGLLAALPFVAFAFLWL